jgi:LuxR family maltose regulon positive regulatory protein
MGKGKAGIVILSKLQIPQIRTKMLYRKRLVKILAENIGKKVILICAGAGYGKTTLLSQFVNKKNITHLYYHLENSDADPAEFLSYLIAGLKKLKPAFGKITGKLRHYFNDPVKYLPIIAGTFVNEIIDNFKEELYIILEDYHTLTDAAMIDGFISYFFDHFPANLHFIITSRKRPYFSLTRLRAKDEVLELTNDDLRFTHFEIRRFLKELYAISLKLSDIKVIEEHSEGWPTSLRLMTQSPDYLEAIKSSGYVKKILDRFYRTQKGLFNYFAQEIYDKEPLAIRRFLLQCSTVEWLSPDLCFFITKQPNAGSMLSAVARRNSFLVKMPGYGYRFHNLFRDFLHSKLTDITEKRQMLRRAALFYEKHGRFEEAIKYNLQVGNYARVVLLINKIGFALIGQGKSTALCSYIEQIPVQLRRANPGLLAIYAQTLIHTGRSDDARKSLEAAARILKQKGKKRIQYADVIYELGGLNFNEGNFIKARTLFRKALTVCPKSLNVTRAAILNSLGLVNTNIGGKYLKQAKDYFERSLLISKKKRYKKLEASIYNNWAMNELKTGNISEAYVKLSQMVKLLKNYFSPHCGSGYFNAARISLLLGYKEHSKEILDTGVEVCKPFNDMWSMASLYKGYSVYYQEIKHLAKAKKYIQRALDIYEQLGIVRLIVSALNEVCKIHIADNELVEADKNLSAIWWFKKDKKDSEAVPLLITDAILKKKQHRFAEAEQILNAARSIAQRFGQVFNEFLIDLELAKVFYGSQQNQKLMPVLRKCAYLSNIMHYDAIMRREIKKNTWLVGVMKENDIEAAYLDNLVSDARSGLYIIEISLFGTPGLVINGNIIPESAWKTDNAKKLFFYMCLHRKKRLSSDCLIDVFWPRASRRAGKDNLRKTVQYIRGSLGKIMRRQKEVIITQKGTYSIAAGVVVISDFERFEMLINQALDMSKEPDQQRTLLKQAADLYSDHFARGWYEPWVEERRAYFQRKYEECLLWLADSCFHEGLYKQAVAWYEKLLSINFYNEDYHRKLMDSYAKIGRLRDIIKDFESLKKILKKELNTTPQKKTIDVYNKLIK